MDGTFPYWRPSLYSILLSSSCGPLKSLDTFLEQTTADFQSAMQRLSLQTKVFVIIWCFGIFPWATHTLENV